MMRALRPYLLLSRRVLEIGSGPIGIGEFYAHSFVGCDVCFPEKPRHPMLPVIAPAERLPFGDRAFDIVLVSDVLEHIPPPARPAVVAEALRVAATVAVFGFPAGPLAHQVDEGLVTSYRARKLPVPGWLKEHMDHPFPESDLLNRLGEEWAVQSLPNETLDFHRWMMEKEISLFWRTAFKVAVALAPRSVEQWLRTKDTEPCYRRIFVVSRTEPTPALSCSVRQPVSA